MIEQRVTDRAGTDPWAWMRLWRPTSADPRVILVRAVCGCGWVAVGDPPETLGQMAEHFRGHWDVRQPLPTMTLQEDQDQADDLSQESTR